MRKEKTSLKKGLSIFKECDRENMRYNAVHDDLSRRKSEEYVKYADFFADNLDYIYEEMIVGEGLPRFYFVGTTNDPNRFNCKYCGCAINKKYTTYGWIMDSFEDPWKIKCPDCGRSFPTNDFRSYYRLGLDEKGLFDRELAEKRHVEKFGGLHGFGYLKNELYPEMGDTWGVDDGFGYVHTYTDKNGETVTEQHCYIAYYIHFMWMSQYGNKTSVEYIIISLMYAYLYTGDEKYGCAGAVLLDRIADVYPTFDWYKWSEWRDCKAQYRGVMCDRIWSCGPAKNFAEAYDAFYPCFDDKRVTDFLSAKSKKYKMSSKDTGDDIRRNIEIGLLEEIYSDCITGDLFANFGATQDTLVAAAVAYNDPERSKEMIEYAFRAGKPEGSGPPGNRKGLNILPQLVGVIDRDGMGTEVSPSYNTMWINGLLNVADYLSRLDLFKSYDLYKNPKFLRMFYAHIPTLMGGYYTAQIGDTDAFAGIGKSVSANTAKYAYLATKDIKFAQLMHFANGGSAKGLRYPETYKEPSRLEDEVNSVINKYGKLQMGSTAQYGYGLYALRDGKSDGSINTVRDFWMYGGANNGHGHRDSLNLGIDAFGLNMAPDLGYPKDTGTEPNRIQWVSATISHNTVVVDNISQKPSKFRGSPLHFDDSGKVKLMDVRRKESYEQTSEYRRTVLMIDINDEVSYGVDFFRVTGGNDHLYSFHSQSNNVTTDGLTLKAEEPKNTYAGYKYSAYFEKAPDPHPDSGKTWDGNHLTYPPGYTWMDNVTSDTSPEKQFSVDFKITDFRKVLKDGNGLHLKMTMVNDFFLDEVTVLSGYPVDNYKNPDTDIKYVLARRTGRELDTLFSTVFEPYKDDRYIEKISSVSAVCSESGESAGSDKGISALKIVHKNNRTDYIVYSEKNSVEYIIDGKFRFKGFVCVVMYNDPLEKEPSYIYLNDGTAVADIREKVAAYTGTVSDFTKELSLENKIVVEVNEEITDETLSEMKDRTVFVENDGSDNGAYTILNAYRRGDNKIDLDIGNVSVIRSYIDDDDLDRGFVYNISEGQSFTIPMSYVVEK